MYNIHVWLSRSGQQVKGSVFGVLSWLFYAICTLMGESVLWQCGKCAYVLILKQRECLLACFCPVNVYLVNL